MNHTNRSPCIDSKGAKLIILVSLFMSSPLTLLQLMGLNTGNLTYLFLTINAVMFLLFPIFGLLGEYWMRARIMLLGSVFIISSCTCYAVMYAVKSVAFDDEEIQMILLIISYIYFFGQTWLLANVIQFGVDQLQFSPSQKLSNFVCWFYMIFYTYPGLCLAVFSVTAFVKIQSINYVILSVLMVKVFINTAILLFIMYLRKYLTLEPAQRNNPIKLIWKVTMYSKNNNKHARSAFTYGDPPPSKLDFAKERYGGPFTTEQVENVRSFWQIFLLFLTTYGYAFRAFPICLTDKILNGISAINHSNETTYTLGQSIILLYPFTIPFLTVSVCILSYQLIVIPFFPEFIPRMLVRMWIGLVIVFLQVITLTFLNYSNSHSYTLLLIPQILYGLSLVSFFITIFEFALAQSPKDMMGLLIGFFYMYYGFSYLDIILSKSIIGCYWEYHGVKTILVIISLILYSIVAYNYKPRQRNEYSDVNERTIITEYTERHLEWKKEEERRSLLDSSV